MHGAFGAVNTTVIASKMTIVVACHLTRSSGDVII